MSYDHIATEFDKISRRLAWPRSATIKDFRHFGATCLENAGMPEHYRKFLVGTVTWPGRRHWLHALERNSRKVRRRDGEDVSPTG